MEESLLSNLSKIFTSIINQRIMLWSEQEKIGQRQAVFRQGKSTIDQMFILKTLIDKHLFRKRDRFYCLLISQKHLTPLIVTSLIKSRMHWKMLKLIRKVYSKVTATVRTKEGLTELFDCKLGVGQGCMLSPRLFIMFMSLKNAQKIQI